MKDDHSIFDIGLNYQFITPKPFLGEEDATIEWAGEDKPADIFLHTRSYRTFKRKDCLFMFGSRGTGKTAMINMLKYEVQKELVPDYTYAWIVNQEDAYNDLAIQIHLSPLCDLPQGNLVHLLTKKWLWIITVSAMSAVVKEEYSNLKNDKNLSIIDKYLRDQKLQEKNPLKHFIDIFTEELECINYSPIQTGTALIKIAKRIETPEYELAKESLLNFLNESNGTCIVMVDSIEFYDLKDKVAEAVVIALIEASQRMYNAIGNHITTKVALPFEMYHHISSFNREKMEGKNMFVQWQYHDIVSLLAKRYFQLVKKNHTQNDFIKLNDFIIARNFLYDHLPNEIETESNIFFDTLAYIIRHTQKKPRQVIILFNTILTIAEHNDHIPSNITSDQIILGVHARLDILTKGCLDMYEQIYPEVSKLARRGLTSAPGFFDYSTLDTLLKEVSSLRAGLGLGLEDVKRILFEAGILGLWVLRFRSKNPNKSILLALFEYQTKNMLTITTRDKCIVHPMFYQEFNIVLNKDTFVYPNPIDVEEKKMIEDHAFAYS